MALLFNLPKVIKFLADYIRSKSYKYSLTVVIDSNLKENFVVAVSRGIVEILRLARVSHLVDARVYSNGASQVSDACFDRVISSSKTKSGKVDANVFLQKMKNQKLTPFWLFVTDDPLVLSGRYPAMNYYATVAAPEREPEPVPVAGAAVFGFSAIVSVFGQNEHSIKGIVGHELGHVFGSATGIASKFIRNVKYNQVESAHCTSSSCLMQQQQEGKFPVWANRFCSECRRDMIGFFKLKKEGIL